MAEVPSATRAARVSPRWQRRSSAPLAPRRSAGLVLNPEPCAYCGFAVPSIGCRYCTCSRRPALCDATCMARFWQDHKPSCAWHEPRKLIHDLLGVGSVSTLVMRYVGRMPRGPSGQEDTACENEGSRSRRGIWARPQLEASFCSRQAEGKLCYAKPCLAMFSVL